MLDRTVPPLVWWAATTPCTSLYVPVAVTGRDLPLALSTAGGQHGAGPNPEQVHVDTPVPGSYWWSFQSLLEAVAGDDQGSRYHERQPEVRNRFDALQQKWLERVDALLFAGTDAQWQALTEECVMDAQAVADEFVRTFG